MRLFHILTLIVSIVVFLGLFIYTYVVYTEDKNNTYPPDIANCPDFWEVNEDGTCNIPKDGKNTGSLKGIKSNLYTYDTDDDKINRFVIYSSSSSSSLILLQF